MELTNNIHDTALIFEGGGMRGSYTAGFLNVLLENGIHFGYVAGISAGSSHTINYISRDAERARRSFVEFALDPDIGGWGSFFRGEGYFKSRYVYYETSQPGGPLPFNFQRFMANPATVRIGAFERDKGQMRYFGKEDIRQLEDLVGIVCSSSSMPIFMPPNLYDGAYFLDGGLGGGIALDIAKRDGMKKFFVVLTREKHYRKPPAKFTGAIRAFYRKHPQVVEAMLQRHEVYNRTLDELLELESEGKAFLVYPDRMPVSNRELNYGRLVESYEMGHAQGQRDLPEWKRFLGLWV